jgi:predicted permease
VESAIGLVDISSSSIGKPWWHPLLSLINFILLGYCLKTYFGWTKQRTTIFRRVTFNFLLPIYVFRNMWVSSIDASMATIAKVSFMIHVGQAVFWWLLYRNVRDPYMRGWLSMISQGCLTSFFYANLSSHHSFGQQAVAICLLFDIGGNTPCAQGLLWGSAAYFAPGKDAVTPTASFETAFSSPLLRATGSLDSRSLVRQEMSTSLPNVYAKSAKDDLESLESDSLIGGRRAKSVDDQKTFSDIVRAVSYQPILPAFLVGLLLSLSGTGCPTIIDYGLETVGLLFKPCLYFLIGLSSEIITDPTQLRIVVTSLGLRYLFAGFAAVMMWLWLPFGNMERTTMALTFLSPVSTMSMYLAAEYDYPVQYVGMSATLTTVSVFVSFIIQETVMRSF